MIICLRIVIHMNMRYSTSYLGITYYDERMLRDRETYAPLPLSMYVHIHVYTHRWSLPHAIRHTMAHTTITVIQDQGDLANANRPRDCAAAAILGGAAANLDRPDERLGAAQVWTKSHASVVLYCSRVYRLCCVLRKRRNSCFF